MKDDDENSVAKPPAGTLEKVARAAKRCTACPLYKRGTQTVFGEGNSRAKILFIGEQPGDEEDRQGEPFVGPAGAILDRALEEAGINRRSTYVTNAVKHFKWIPRGKRRLHQKPNAREISACRPWLLAELARVKPRVAVCLGVTAATAMLGKAVTIKSLRGKFLSHPLADFLYVTGHPSAILRMPDPAARHEAYAAFVKDLKRIARKLDE